MSVYIAIPREDAYDIKHYGIMGQKWGIRRYQNKDGSLTPEGKARYGSVENFNKVMKAIKTGSAIGGPVGGVIGGAIADKKYRTKGSKNTKNRSATTGKKNVTDEEAIAAAKKAGLHQGDNYKVYRKAMSGDKEAQKIVEKWESPKQGKARSSWDGAFKSGYAKQFTTKATIEKEVARARKEGTYDMEFLEQNLDCDEMGDPLTGKALSDAYRRYLNL